MVPDKVLVSRKSEFQKIEIVEFSGQKALILDDFLQVYTRDEFIYHEMLAHFPMMRHPRPEKILVLGAGDGFLMRELLKYKSVRQVTLVDIDREVVEFSKEHFHEETGGSMDDPRAKIIIDDAFAFAGRTEERFDVIIMDLVAYESGADLYTADNIRKFMGLMAEGGIFATHGDDACAPNHVGIKLFSMISKLFPHSEAAAAYVPSFDSLWTFMVFSKSGISMRNPERPDTRYFEPGRDYSLPPYLKEKLKEYDKKGFDGFLRSGITMKRVSLSDSINDILR